MISTQVLIVGGGLAGLSSALFLAWQGVPSVVVERHSGSSPHPRAIGYTARTLELYRAVGLGPRIPEAPPSFQLRRARIASLAGAWFEEEPPWTPATKDLLPERTYSPCRGAALAQDRLEPLLCDQARELGAAVRFDTELLRFEQDASGVTAWLRERTGHEYTLRADYLIAADGHRSPVRESLRIERSGRGHMRTLRSVLFRAPLEQYLERGVSQFQIEQPGFEAFLTTYGDGRWVLMFSDDHERDAATLEGLIVRALGRSDLPIEIITTGRWELTALIADRFASGRVFLVGDAAHTLPPSRGGYGANTGIQDAHNLAWKLAHVVCGASTPALLESYDAERRPVAWLRHQQIFARADYKPHAAGAADGVQILDDAAVELGQLYRSSAVLGAGDELPAALRPDQWAGQPGSRAPHLWLLSNGERISTLDLLQRRWVVLTEDPSWRAPVAHAAEVLGIDVTCVCVGVDVQPLQPLQPFEPALESDELQFQAAFGLRAGGATLVRPDGYVAWRTRQKSEQSERALVDALHAAAAAVRARDAAAAGSA